MHSRRPVLYVFLLIATIVVGLASRKLCDLPTWVKLYAGDAIWALMVYWGIAILSPKAHSLKIAISSLLFSFAIEISQLYQSKWINQIRDTQLGSLALGHGFLWSDLFAYTVGIVSGVLIEYVLNTTTKMTSIK